MDLKVELCGRFAQISEETQFQETISKVTAHFPSVGFTDVPCNNVTAVMANGCKLLVMIPTNLQDFFPNMIALALVDCGLKAISRKDLKGLKQLTEISFFEHEIKELPADLFADLINLEVIEFKNNRIQFIGKDIFKHLERAKYIDLRGNPGIDVIYATEEFNDVEEIGPLDNRIHNINDLNTLIENTFFSQEVHKDINKILRCDDFKDFSIKIGQKEFKVHKILLVARCPTLAEMIKRTPNVDELILEDIDAEVFEIILDFIYNDKLPTNVENAEELFVATGKLKLEKLKNHVAKWIIPIVSGSNAFKFLQLAFVYNSMELKAKCIEEIKKIIGDTFDECIYDNFELLKVIVEEKLKADEKIQKAVEEFKKMKR